MGALRRTARAVLGVALMVVTVALGLVVLTLGVLRTSVGATWLRDAVLAEVNRRISGRITVGNLGIVGTQITVEDVRLLDPNGAAVAAVDRVAVRWSPWRLLERRIEVRTLVIGGPRVWLRIAPDGSSNHGRALASRTSDVPASAAGHRGPPAWSLRLDSLHLDGGTLALDDERAGQSQPWRRVRLERIAGHGEARWEAKDDAGRAMVELRGEWTEPQPMPFHVRLAGSVAPARAAVDADLVVELGGSELHLVATAEPVGTVPLTPGAVAVYAEVERLQLRPALARLFAPGWPLRLPLTGTGQARWNVETGAAASRLDLRAGKLRVVVTGEGDSKALAIDEMDVHARSIDLAELVEGGVVSDLSLDLAAHGRAVAAGWQGTAVLEVPSGRLAGRPLGPIHLRADVDGRRWRVSQAWATLPGVRVRARGGGMPGKLDVGVDVGLDDLAAVLSSVGATGGAAARGRGRLGLRLGGSPARPSLRIDGALADLSWREVRIPGLRLHVSVPDLRRPLAANARLRAADGQVGTRRLRGLDLRLRANDRRMDATLVLTEPLAIGLNLGGELRQGKREVRLDRGTLQVDGAPWVLERGARLSLDEGSFGLHDLRLTGSGGQSLVLDVDRSGDRWDASVVLSLALGRLPRALLPRALRLDGDLRLEGELHRRGERNELDIEVALAQARVGDLQDVTLRSAVQIRGRRLAGRLDGHVAAAQVNGHLALPLVWPPPASSPVAADLTVAGVDLAFWRRALGALVPALPGAAASTAVGGRDLGGKARVHLVLDGTADRPRLTVAAAVAELRLRDIDVGDLAMHVEAGDAGPLQATVSLDPHGSEAEPAGRVMVELRVDRPLGMLLPPRLSPTDVATLPIHGRVRFDRVDVKTLAMAVRSPRSWAGRVDGSLALDGTLAAPTGVVELSLDGISSHGIPATSGELHLAADEGGAKLSLSLMRRGATLGTLAAHLDAPPRDWRDLHALRKAPLGLSAAIGPLAVRHDGLSDAELRRVQGVLTGSLHGRVEVTGTLAEPRVSLETAVNDLRLDARALGRASLDASYQPGRLQGELRMTSANGGQLHAQAKLEHTVDLLSRSAPWHGWKRAPLHARVDASRLDLAVLSGLTPRLRSVAGELAAHIEVTGSAADPQPSGSVEWRNGELVVSGLGKYRNVHLLARGDRAQWTLDKLTADSGDGHAKLEATGKRDDGLAGYRITSRLRIDRFPAYVEGQALADVSLDAKTQAEVSRGRARAQVDIVSARLALRDVKRKKLQPLSRPDDVILLKGGQPIDDEHKHKQASKRRALGRRGGAVGAGSESPAVEPTEPGAVLLLRGSNDLWIRSKEANIELGLEPGFRVELDSGTSVYGRVTIKRGIVNVVGRRFDLKAGSSLRFHGDPGLPELDVSARHVNHGENVTVVAVVKGTPGHLDTSISSPNRPELTESQLYTLVVTGRLSLGGGSASSATPAQQAETVLGGLLASQLQAVLAEKLPFDVLTIEGGSRAGSARVEAGKYLTSDLYVGYVGRLGVDPVSLQNRSAVHLEYHLGARWSFQGEYGDAKTGSADVVWTHRY